MGSIFDDIDEVAYNLEPYATGLSLGGAYATFIPVYGPAIAAAAQVPSLLIDGYQAGRSLYKGDMSDAAWNAAEAGLDLASVGGLKLLAKSAAKTKPVIRSSTRVHSTYPRPRAKKYIESQAKNELLQLRKEGTKYLAKRGVRPSQGKYFEDRLNRYIMQKVNRQNALKNAALNDAITNDKVFIPFVSAVGNSAFQGSRLINERTKK